jgi:hypothetical protein
MLDLFDDGCGCHNRIIAGFGHLSKAQTGVARQISAVAISRNSVRLMPQFL